jgi:iron complex transport system ATP-binding protein
MKTGPSPALLDLCSIRVMRGQNVVLDDLTLRIHPGEHVVILGPNGCGKSTLVKTITRECYPVVRDGSSMTILGKDRWNLPELRSLLGIVANDLISASIAGVTARELVLSSFFSSLRIFPHHRVTTDQEAAVASALARLQIAHLAGRPVGELSSGEARRVVIARALVHQPKTLLFDEPSNSLDFYARHSLRETMSGLARSGIGIVLVTHDLADIIPEIERVVLMAKGRVAADGSKQEMLQPQRLSALFGTPVEIARKDGYYHLW